ncbi:MAG: ABC transporter ATP-binding protein/permease [Ruminococcus sp.]|nr:ABC transporter ATP-binding protein/permease [Ruminococcus sp.]
MGKLFKNLVPHWKALILIGLLLCVQAWCDLALPQYTSDIIDTGIQNCGVEHILPEKITADEYKYAELFMTDSEAEDFASAYKDDGKYYTLIISDDNKLKKIDDELIIPIMMDYQLSRLPVSSIEKITNGQKIPDVYVKNLKHKTIEQENENGEIVKVDCADVRPLIATMTQMSDEADEMLKSMRAMMKKQIDALGTDTMMSSGKAYAVEMDRLAGVDVDTIQTNYLWLAGLKMVLIALVLTAASVLVGLLAARVGAGVGRTLRTNVFKKVIGFSNTEIDKFSAASLITRSTNDIQQIQFVMIIMLRMVLYAPIIGIGGVIKVAGTGAQMAWVIAVAVIAIMVSMLTLVFIAMPKFKRMQTLVDKINLVSREILTGIPVIRAFVREKEEEKRFDEANVALTKTTLFTNRVMTFMMPLMTFLMNIVSVLIVWVASGHINDGNMQVGEMTAFITYSMQIIISFLMLTMMSILLPRAVVAAGRIDEVVKAESSITDAENAYDLKTDYGIVEFKKVGFRYPGAEENVLSNISFRACPGKTTAIIGSTGSGKSTLVNLIPRLYDVTEGSIEIDGNDIRGLTMKSLRNEIGYVPQKGILFSGTIASNLRFGKTDADDSEIERAAEIAQATEFIEEKTERYNSEISQGGTNVSGGQKQRLAIARAIAKAPRIYIFDDSFSALDMKTDKELRKALSESVSNSTVIIVAQRISTIVDAEQIIVLDEGKIAGIGTHRELLKTCEPYLEIAKSQLSEKELGLGEEAENNG